MGHLKYFKIITTHQENTYVSADLRRRCDEHEVRGALLGPGLGPGVGAEGVVEEVLAGVSPGPGDRHQSRLAVTVATVLVGLVAVVPIS